MTAVRLTSVGFLAAARGGMIANSARYVTTGAGTPVAALQASIAANIPSAMKVRNQRNTDASRREARTCSPA